MATVGSRELKTRLGTYLRRVQQGASFVVTDRGRPVAELGPLRTAGGGIEARLEEMLALGEATWQARGPLPPFQPIELVGASMAQGIIEDREDRF